MTFTRFGIRIPDADVHAAEDGTVVMQADGQPVTRFRTETAMPVPGVCCCGVRLSTWSPPVACCCGEHVRDGGRVA